MRTDNSTIRLVTGRGPWRLLLAGALGVALALGMAVMPVAARTYTVVMDNVTFMPSPLRVHVGDYVTWSNRDIIARQVVPDNGGFLASGIIKPGHSYSARITKSGTVSYHDGINSFARGTLIVSSVAVATPRPTTRATVRPTTAPTIRPTPKPTTRPTTKPSASATTSANGTASPGATAGGGGTSTGPGGSAGPGAGNSPGSTGGSSGGFDPLVVLIAGLVTVGLAFVAGAAVFSTYRSRQTPIVPTASVVAAALGGSRPAPLPTEPTAPSEPDEPLE